MVSRFLIFTKRHTFFIPVLFSLSKVILVRIIVSYSNHTKILIFNDTFIFQIYLHRIVCPFIMSEYVDFTLIKLEIVSLRTRLSGSLHCWININLYTRFSHTDNYCWLKSFWTLYLEVPLTIHLPHKRFLLHNVGEGWILFSRMIFS
jgi:hypothetical protein